MVLLSFSMCVFLCVYTPVCMCGLVFVPINGGITHLNLPLTQSKRQMTMHHIIVELLSRKDSCLDSECELSSLRLQFHCAVTHLENDKRLISRKVRIVVNFTVISFQESLYLCDE
jgi:hypothetical protein